MKKARKLELARLLIAYEDEIYKGTDYKINSEAILDMISCILGQSTSYTDARSRNNKKSNNQG